MTKRLLFFGLIFHSCSLWAQLSPLLQGSFNSQIEQENYFSENHFTAFKASFLPVDLGPDSLEKTHFIESEWAKDFSPEKPKFFLDPAFSMGLGMQNGNDNFIRDLGLGLRLQGQINSSWNYGFSYLHQQVQYMDFESRQIDQYGVVPGVGLAKGADVISSDFISGFVNYKAPRFFEFELGYGQQFIGDGYRSLLASDFAPPAPYFKIHTKVWKIKYSNLFRMHQNIYGVEGRPSQYQQKFSASHFLDWEITDWLQLGLFETIVWQSDEGRYNRGFDANYLNPVIFYRPVEFSVGSSDNALIGSNLKFTLPKKHLIYSQIILDEFLLAEIQADFNQWRNPDQDIRSGWWGNKYGLQLGWRKFDWFGVQGLETRMEYNLVRPFTYAHNSPSQAYSHFNLPLAHPLGANFREALLQVQYRKDRWLYATHINYAEKGNSPDGTNYGENLELSNSSRVQEYENKIGQGILETRIYFEGSLAYMLHKKWSSIASLTLRYQESEIHKQKTENYGVYFSIRTPLFNPNFNY